MKTIEATQQEAVLEKKMMTQAAVSAALEETAYAASAEAGGPPQGLQRKARCDGLLLCTCCGRNNPAEPHLRLA